ncbi:MAG: STAS domain-containing protein [Planctomycetaceae bacterium]
MLLRDFDPTYISLYEQGDVVVAAFAVDQVTEDDNVELLGRELFTLTDQLDVKKVILSLHNVTRVTSSVLGKLITLHRKLHRHSGRLIICNLKGEVAAVMHASRLSTYFQITADLDGALKSIA